MLPAVFVFLSRLSIGEKSSGWWKFFTESGEMKPFSPVLCYSLNDVNNVLVVRVIFLLNQI